MLKRQKDTLCSPLSISDFSEYTVCSSAPRISFRLSVCWVRLVWHLSEQRLVSVQLSITVFISQLLLLKNARTPAHFRRCIFTFNYVEVTANAAMHENILSVRILLLWLNHYRQATVLSSPPLSAFFVFPWSHHIQAASLCQEYWRTDKTTQWAKTDSWQKKEKKI